MDEIVEGMMEAIADAAWFLAPIGVMAFSAIVIILVLLVVLL